MKLNFKREDTKYEVEVLKLPEQDSITMIELFVKNKLDDQDQEVFYTELNDKEVTTENVKNALYQAVLSNVSVTILKHELKEYTDNPEQYQEKVNEFLAQKAN